MKPIYRAEIKVFPNGQCSIGENTKSLTIREAEMVLKATLTFTSRVHEEMKKQLGISEIELTREILDRNPDKVKIPLNK